MPQEDSERVTVRLLSKDLKVLESLVKSGKYATLSEVIRAAINNFIETQFAPDNISKLTISFPKGNVVKLEEFVKSGESDSISVEDAVRNVVRDFVQNRVDKLLREYEEKK